MVKYFGDLPQVLETTYEQHIIGTSEIMKNYITAFFDYQLSYNQKLIIQAFDDKEETDMTNKFLLALRKSYVKKVSSVGSASSLIGMLAAPPFRKPFGSAMKRIYIKKLTEILLSGKKLNLKKIYELYVRLYSTIYDPSNNSIVFIEPIESLFKDSMKRTEKEYIEYKFKQHLIEAIKSFYSKRILGVSGQMDLIRLYSPAYVMQIIAHFLLRFRTLSSLLGLGYSVTRILEAMYNAFSRLDERKNIGEFEEVLLELEESILILLEALLINHSSSILGLYEARKLRVYKNNGTDHNEHEEYLILTPIGSYDTIVCFTNIDPMSDKLCSGLPSDLKTGTNVCEGDKKCFEVSDIAVENKKVRLKEIKIIKKPLTSFYEDFEVPCCILEVNRPSNNALLVNILKEINKKVSTGLAGHIILQLFGSTIHLNDKAHETDGYIINKIKKYENQIKIPPWSQLFLRYFTVNLIQSDMIPSAFQLDLLNRLSKDVKMGWQVDYDDLGEIVLNLENYAYLTYSMLSSIYTSLFSDLSVLSYRTTLLRVGSFTDQMVVSDGCNLALDKIVQYSMFYYSVLSNEFKTIAKQIKKLQKYINKKTIRNNSSQYIISKLIEFSSVIKELLIETSNLIDAITTEIISDMCNKNPNNIIELFFSKNLGINIKDVKFTSFSDFFVESIHSFFPREKTTQINLTPDETEKVQPIQINGMINLVEVLLRNEKLSKQLPEKYNDLSYKTLLILQSTLGVTLNKALVEKIRINCPPKVDPIIAVIHVPIQGVFKPNFHLPYPIPSFPKLAVTGVMKNYKRKCRSDNIVRRILCINSRHQEIDIWMKNYPDVEISELLNDLKDKPLSIDGETILVPDTGLWNTVGSSDILSEEISYKEGRGSHIQITKVPYHLSFIIYSVVFNVPSGRENHSGINIATLQNCVINSISDLIADFF